MPNASPVNTKKVNGRREVRYESLSDLLQDAERLAKADVKLVGNWSRGQIYEHLAKSLDVAIDGTKPIAAPLRFIMKLFFMKKFLHVKIPAGFPAGKFAPDETSVEAGLDSLRHAIARQTEISDRAIHPGFGRITTKEWDLFNLRHAELHMSFIVEN